MGIASILRLLIKGNGKTVTEVATKAKVLNKTINPTRSQSYYDDFAKSLDEGISCYNPRTGNTTLCKGNTLVVRQGNASLESTFTPWGSISRYAESSSSTYLTEVNFYPGNKAHIKMRKDKKYGIYDPRFPYSSPFLNSYNSTSIK